MKNNLKYLLITLLTTACGVLIFAIFYHIDLKENSKVVRVGYIYEGDGSTPYTANFMKAQKAVEEAYGDQVESFAFYNTKDNHIAEIEEDVLSKDLDIVFGTSFGFNESLKKWAKAYPDTQFCQVAAYNANEDPVLPNYHNYMGTVYEARYASGVIAGAKMRELIDAGEIDSKDVVIGYVAAFPYPEVISGYTAFFLGVRNRVPEATMKVVYSNTWSNYSYEKELTKFLIQNDCILISQHSDTIGPAVACQEAAPRHIVYHVGYNSSMLDVAPTSSICSAKIDWAPYEVAAVGAVLHGKRIESCIDGTINGQDAWAGFNKDWVKVIALNENIAAKGSDELLKDTINKLKSKKIDVFKGDLTGTNPFDPNDTIDLSRGFIENEKTSAPTFKYVLDDVVEVLEYESE